jgi:hypothetical protein
MAIPLQRLFGGPNVRSLRHTILRLAGGTGIEQALQQPGDAAEYVQLLDGALVVLPPTCPCLPSASLNLQDARSTLDEVRWTTAHLVR